MSNFSCIGLHADDPAAFEELVGRLLDAAVEELAPRGSLRHPRWTDPSGASVAFHMERDAIACVTPFFDPPAGLSQWRVRTSAPADDPECVHCGGADCDILDGSGELATRATVQWLYSAAYREWLLTEREFMLEVVAFAHAAAFAPDRAAFDAVQASFFGDAEGDDEPLRLAEEAFLPEGMFASDAAPVNERATAVLTGRVESAATARNTVADTDFVHVRLASFPGAIDVVCDPRELDRMPAPGDLGFVRAWLVGRPSEPPPTPAERSWLDRIFGRR